ncbi:ABC transporter substrate-binding protein [Vagococcus carniphilus]|uniref:ABC transporter substrate-binding protein n=1 Tax=Vagococcus carniphilus TaxID=218144 RepID=A0AAW8UB15_9ENTE|nr:ABC transporter substrate-binding protein [Vagococcus carniphilus]MDT2835002.1 ABC transporter substrate-binding protein [Vagococcus carniphilus]MDT2863737.1 ABC transporter substrate-binding protein [Vagococcus carniphilus]
MDKKWLFGLTAVVGVTLTACGSNKTEAPKEKKDKDTFTYAINGDPTSLNPINVSDRWGLTTTNMIYSPLVRIEGDGTQKMELAKEVTPADDGKSVTVKLKDNITWSDGEKLTADDVVFTYEQKVKKENGNADSLWIGDKPVEVEKVDETTVKFNLPSVSAAALNNIATETYIIPEHVFKDEKDFSANELKAKAVGTGPYKLKEYKRGEYLQFEANETYYGGKPNIDKVTLRIIANADTTKVALQKGEVDASYILPNNIEDIKKADITTYEYSENRVGYMGVNNNSEKLKDQKVRQAIFYALNKDELNKAGYLSDKYYENVYSILPPNNPFSTDKVEKYDTDVEKSKSLLKEAGVDKLKLNIAFSSDDPVQTVQATLMQQQLQKAGITLELAGGDGTAIFAEMQKPETTKYDLFMGGYIMGNDPDLYSSLFKSTGSSNYFHYQSEATDKLFNDGAVELDEAKRKDIYADLQKQIAEDAVFYPIVDSKKVLAANKHVENVDKAGLIPIYTFEDLSKLSIK